MKWCLRLFILSLHFLFRFRFSNAIAMRITNKNTERKIPIRLFISNPLTEISMWLCWLHFELSLFATFSVLVIGGRIRKIFRTFCNHFRLSRQNFSLVIGPFPVVLLVLVFFRNFVCLWFVSTRFNFSIAQFKQVEKRTSIAFRTTIPESPTTNTYILTWDRSEFCHDTIVRKVQFSQNRTWTFVNVDSSLFDCSSGGDGSLLAPTPDSCLVSLINYHHRQKYFLIKNVRGKKRAVTNMKNNSFDLFQNECICLCESFHTDAHSAAHDFGRRHFFSFRIHELDKMACIDDVDDGRIHSAQIRIIYCLWTASWAGLFSLTLSLSSSALWFRLIVRG